MYINDLVCPQCSTSIAASPGKGLSVWDRLRLRILEQPAPVGSLVHGPCWVWQGGKSGRYPNVYGAIQEKGKVLKVHRVTYEMFRGPITPGLVVDHLCEKKLCCNPNHLETVTDKINIQRRDQVGFTIVTATPIGLPDLHAPFNFPAGMASVCCPKCQLLIPGAPSAHLPLEDRLMLRVQKRPAPEEAEVEGDCWVWTGSSSNGYGHLSVKGKLLKAYRVGYELWRGPIPDGLVLDHLCRVTLCLSPLHLEAVSQYENMMRGVGASALNKAKTHCKRGHELIPENLRPSTTGERRCLLCRRTTIDHRLKENRTRWGLNGDIHH